MIVAAALEFTFVNSFLEEFFWRVYLYRELTGYNHSSSSNPLQNDDIDEETGLKEYGSYSRSQTNGSHDSDRITIDLNIQNNENDDLRMDNGYFTSERFGGNGISIFGLPFYETPKIFMSCYYASYHVIILLCFVQWWLAIAGFFGLVFLGRIFVYCRENEVFKK